MPALNAVRFSEPACAALCERVYERSHIKPGRRRDESLAVQKKLLTLCFALWKNEAICQPNHLPTNSRNKVMGQKIVPLVGTTQDQLAVAELSYI